MIGHPSNDSVPALVGIVRASLRALRAAVADLTFAPENVRRLSNEAETLSAALGRLDRMLVASPALRSSSPAAQVSTFTLDEVRALLARMRRLQEPDGLCSTCGGVRPARHGLIPAR